MEPRTIKEVAKLLGVAPSSVSRALNDHPDISAGMKSRVLEGVRDLGYEPDHVARSLRRGATQTIGFIVRDVASPLFADIVKGAESVLREAGYSLLLVNSGEDATMDRAHIETFRRRQVDGLIVSLQSETANGIADLVASLRFPVVLIDRELEGVHTFAVHSDYQSGLREATESLLVMGHRRIAFITGPPDIRTTRQRLSGYRLAHADHAIPVIEPLVRLGSYHQGWGYSQMTELLRSDEPPTAVIAGSLSILYGILAAARDSGVRLGRDLSVISCDETELLQYLEPPINVVRRDPFTLGEIAAELLLGALSPGFDGVPVVRVVPTQYVMRAPVQPPGAS